MHAKCFLQRSIIFVSSGDFGLLTICMHYVKSRVVQGILRFLPQRAHVSCTRHVTNVSLAWLTCTPRKRSAITMPFVAPGQCSAARLLPRGVRHATVRNHPPVATSSHCLPSVPGVVAKSIPKGPVCRQATLSATNKPARLATKPDPRPTSLHQSGRVWRDLRQGEH